MLAHLCVGSHGIACCIHDSICDDVNRYDLRALGSVVQRQGKAAPTHPTHSEQQPCLGSPTPTAFTCTRCSRWR